MNHWEQKQCLQQTKHPCGSKYSHFMASSSWSVDQGRSFARPQMLSCCSWKSHSQVCLSAMAAAVSNGGTPLLLLLVALCTAPACHQLDACHCGLNLTLHEHKSASCRLDGSLKCTTEAKNRNIQRAACVWVSVFVCSCDIADVGLLEGSFRKWRYHKYVKWQRRKHF